MRIFVLDSEEKRQRLIGILGKIPLQKPLQVTVEEYNPTRSGQANRRYWAILSEISNKTGHDRDELHDFFKEKFLGTRVIEIGGERATVSPSSRRLRVDEFRAYMDSVENWAIEHLGIWLE